MKSAFFAKCKKISSFPIVERCLPDTALEMGNDVLITFQHKTRRTIPTTRCPIFHIHSLLDEQRESLYSFLLFFTNLYKNFIYSSFSIPNVILVKISIRQIVFDNELHFRRVEEVYTHRQIP